VQTTAHLVSGANDKDGRVVVVRRRGLCPRDEGRHAVLVPNLLAVVIGAELAGQALAYGTVAARKDGRD
jgi:hypothetical protein